MRKSRCSEERIIAMLRRAEAGQTVAEGCRQYGIREGT
jgi:Transposase